MRDWFLSITTAISIIGVIAVASAVLSRRRMKLRSISDEEFLLAYKARFDAPEDKVLFERASKIAPQNAKLKMAVARYGASRKAVETVEALKHAGLISEEMCRFVKPELTLIRNSRHRSGDSRCAEDEIDSLSHGSPGGQDDQGAILADIARTFHAQGVRGHAGVNLDGIEELFRSSLRINDQPRTRLWYGTFLKDLRGDTVAAREQYETARDLAEATNSMDVLRRALNNIALLTINDFELGRCDLASLRAAEEMVLRATEICDVDDFRWPAITLNRCRQLLAANTPRATPSSGEKAV